MHADCLVSLFVSLFGCLLHLYNLQSVCSLFASIPLRGIWLKSVRVLVLLSFQQKCSSGLSSEVLELLVVNSSISVKHCFKDIFCNIIYISVTSWLMPVFLLFSWCSHFISLSSSHPQSTILCVILLALFFTATFVLQQTSTFVYTGLTKLSFLLPCDSCQKEWAVHLKMTTKLVLTFRLVAFLDSSTCCVLNANFTTSTDLNYLSITFCKSPSCDKSCDTYKNLKFRFLNLSSFCA